MVDATKADFRFLGLQDHYISLHRRDGDTGLFVETPRRYRSRFAQSGRLLEREAQSNCFINF